MQINNSQKTNLILFASFIIFLFLGTFTQNYKITIGVDFALKSLQWDENTLITLQLW